MKVPARIPAAASLVGAPDRVVFKTHCRDVALSLLFALGLGACGSGGGSPVPMTYTIGGTIAGLSGTVVLQNNGGDDLTRSADGGFAFAIRANNGSNYSVTVRTQPVGKTCNVSNGSGTISNANVTSVRVNCAQSPPPYPPSSFITGITWAAASSIVRLAAGSDNWPTTWADDGDLYTAYGDGFGFTTPQVLSKLSLGLGKISGGPDAAIGTNIRSATGEQLGDGKSGKKPSGMLMVDGTLYMWARNANLDGTGCQLAWSQDHAVTWTWSSWKFNELGYCAFLEFGQNYAGARDQYVYIYSPDSASAYIAADRMILARVLKSAISDRNAYEFLVGLDGNGAPLWTTQIGQRGAVFTQSKLCLRSGISYNAALGRYLWWQQLPVNGSDTRFSGGFGIYDAPEPWGPWTTVYYTEQWDVGPGERGSFPPKWMSADGRTMYLVFSGDDSFSVRQATITTLAASLPLPPSNSVVD